MPDVNVRLIDVWLENPAGERVENIEQGEPIGFNVIFEARHDLAHPVFGFHFLNADGVQLFGFNRALDPPDGEPDDAARGPPGPAVRARSRTACCPAATRSAR